MSASAPSGLGIALLTLLVRHAATGYDLARHLRASVGNFWTAGHSQIYPELSRLEAAGLVTHEVVEGAGPRPTKRYLATPAGVDAVRSFTAADAAPEPTRDTELMQVYSLWLLPRDEARAVLLRHRARHAEAAARYAAQDTAERWADDARAQYARATLRWGVAAHEARVAWYDDLLADL